MCSMFWRFAGLEDVFKVMFEKGIRWIRVCVRGYEDSQDLKARFTGFDDGFERFVCCGDSQDSKMRFIAFEDVFEVMFEEGICGFACVFEVLEIRRT